MTKKALSQVFPWLGRTSVTAAILLFLLAELLGLYNTTAITWVAFVTTREGIISLLQIGLLAMLAAGTVIGGIVAGRRAAPYPPAMFLCVIMGSGIVVHLLLAAYVQPEWGTDYLRYWQHAQELVRQGIYSGKGGPFDSRALLVPYPVIRLFGPDATFALKLVNVFLLTACQLFVYDILRRTVDHRAAQAATILFTAAPILAYVTLIPSHDLWGMFFLAGATWIITLGLFPSSGSLPRLQRWIPLAMLAGVVAYLTEVQRSTGRVFCAALVLTALLSWLASWQGGGVALARRRAFIALMASVLCLGAQFGASRVASRLELRPGPNTAVFMMKVASHSGGMGNGTNAWFVRFNNRFGGNRYSAEEAVDFAKSMALSSWALQPRERLAHFANESQKLFELSASWGWLMRNPKGLSPHARNLIILYANFYGVMFGVLLVCALAKLAAARRPPPFPILALLIMILALAFTLLTLFESKSLNIFPVWFAACLAIGCALVRGAPSQVAGPAGTEPLFPRDRIRALAEGTALIVAVALVAFAVLRAAYRTADGRLIDDWTFHDRQAQPVRDDGWKAELLDARPEAFDPASFDPRSIKKTFIKNSEKDGDRIQKYAGDAVVRMQFPAAAKQGDRLDMETRVCNTTGDRPSLEYFLFSPKQGKSTGRFDLTVSIDGHEVQRSRLPLAGKNFRRFVLDDAIPDRSCHTLGFRLEASRLSDTVPASRTPFAEIWAPRLIP